jgi:uncharacterized protein YkwD
VKKSRKSAWVLAAALVCLIATGCAPPKKKTVVVRKKPQVRCTSAAKVEKQILRLINRARSSGGKCGGKRFRPAATVNWNDALARAARSHSKDMAGRNRLGHKGSGNSTVEKRVRRAGYTWRAVGENVAGGLDTCEAVLSGWLKSPGHCANIMDPAFTDIGAACAQSTKSRYGTYWTLVLAAPLK